MLASFLNDIRDGDKIVPKRLADRLSLPLTRLSKLAHVNRNALTAAPNSPAVQDKLGEIAQIISKASELTEDEGASIIWFKYQSIPGFGKTAQQLVEDGKADAVLWYIDTVDDGGVA